MQSSILDFDDYKSYLNKTLEERGLKQKLSEAVGFQSAFLSRVLSDVAELSLEQAIKVSAHLNHTAMERDYFILLVTRDKAGSADLRAYYDSKIQEAKKGHDKIGNEALKGQVELSETEKATFYSSWLYQAVSVLITIPDFQDRRKLAKRLKVTDEDVSKVLEFLIKTGLVSEKGNVLTYGNVRTHVLKTSPFAIMNAHNWRLRASNAMAMNPDRGIHYTSVYSLSKPAAERFRVIVAEAIRQLSFAAQEPNEEIAMALVLDLFDV